MNQDENCKCIDDYIDSICYGDHDDDGDAHSYERHKKRIDELSKGSYWSFEYGIKKLIERMKI